MRNLRPSGPKLNGPPDFPAETGERKYFALEMSETERRDFPRVAFPVLVLYRSGPGTSYESAYGADLSLSGIRIRGPSPPLGTMVDLQLVERRGLRPVDLIGEVTRVGENSFAVRFVELEPLQHAWLSRVVHGRAHPDVFPETEDLLDPSFDEA